MAYERKGFEDDSVPSLGQTIGEEYRECGPLDPNFSQADVDKRLAKQRSPTSLDRVGQTPSENQIDKSKARK